MLALGVVELDGKGWVALEKFDLGLSLSDHIRGHSPLCAFAFFFFFCLYILECCITHLSEMSY